MFTGFLITFYNLFTGIIKNLGFNFYIKYIFKFYFYFFIKIFKKNFLDLLLGDSLSIQGICLTLIYKNNNFLEFEIFSETISYFIPEFFYILNLEKSFKFINFNNGFLILSHINNSFFLFKKYFKKNELNIIYKNLYKKYFLYKCSITLNGVNLTINRIFYFNKFYIFTLNIINFTNYNTNLNLFKIFSNILVEIDLIFFYILSIICI